MTQSTEKQTYPSIGEHFALTIEHPLDPMEMVRVAGYNPKKWKFNGHLFGPRGSRNFTLVRVGQCDDFHELQTKLEMLGSLASGFCRDAFKRMFPAHDGKGPIGFPDKSWGRPDRFPFFSGSLPGYSSYIPIITSRGHPDFYKIDFGFDGNWRWLVRVKDE